MHKIKRSISYAIFLFFLSSLSAQGGWLPWSPDILVSIGDTKYSTEDFTTWWHNWQEPGMKVPDTPKEFTNWMLLFDEAERMKLYESPVYRKKVLVFLKTRTLMLLKGEEIDKKIRISDNDLWQKYLTTYAPRYQIRIFFFKKQDVAQKFVDKFGKDPISNDDFEKQFGRKDNYYSQRTEWYRPLAINPGWIPILATLQKGTISQPVPWKSDFIVLRLQDKLEGSREDFDTVRKALQKVVWKDKEGQLTVELLQKLRKKYKIVVNTERLKELQTDATDESLSDTPLIATSKGDISEKIVLAKIRQLENFRIRNGFINKTSFQFKNQVVNGIIDQTLTSWEGLARKYEEKQPFKSTFQFYCQHRMIKLLEEQIFQGAVKISPKEITTYYQNNSTLFTQPEVVRIALIQGTEEGLNALWLETALGHDFIALAEKSTGGDIPVQDMPSNHLSKNLKEILDKLTINEVSPVFMDKGHATLVQLIGRKAAQTIPLAAAEKEIKKSLFDKKLKKLRQDYLNKLEQKYPVTIDKAVWKNLKQELEHLDETK
jgi:parvulin-like peptidyl-prolyl isomerase